ncbi:hypothetical protein M0813_03254 [Anaeramoeba flamelloides]|uniref:Uncharacterized protein n=1 Tax=Anaeramoeba flamelloides TaxID=1746091 RepID=A0ABQ8XZT3_9EUKA|nr:hypothetical protein M0813_03254 [Anaeramoeba flamelloides]
METKKVPHVFTTCRAKEKIDQILIWNQKLITFMPKWWKEHWDEMKNMNFFIKVCKINNEVCKSKLPKLSQIHPNCTINKQILMDNNQLILNFSYHLKTSKDYQELWEKNNNFANYD